MVKTKISEFTQDPNNANKGTDRGAEMVKQSLEKLGAGRSVLVDKNGVLIAGNKTAQAAIDAGLLDAIVVQTEGDRLVFGFELSPEYIEVVCRRWEKFTGGVAELAGHL